MNNKQIVNALRRSLGEGNKLVTARDGDAINFLVLGRKTLTTYLRGWVRLKKNDEPVVFVEYDSEGARDKHWADWKASVIRYAGFTNVIMLPSVK